MSELTWPDEGLSVLLMTTTAATQESKVTEGITITAAEVQKGDTIRVRLAETDSGDRKYTVAYEGVAAKPERVFNGKPVWRTEQDWNLYVHEDNAVIELLDRPKPKIVLPTGEHAVVEYKRHGARRIAVNSTGWWRTYDAYGDHKDTARTANNLARIISDHGTDFTVLFEGVAK